MVDVGGLHIVTGKGGTGKTTVAAALSLALADSGEDTILIEVEGRQAIAEVFDCDPLPYAETAVATAAGGGTIWALAVDPEAALIEYLAMFYHLGRAGKSLAKIGAIEFATSIAPGIRDVLLTGKVKEVANRTEDKGRGRVYSSVVLDAPPTGRITRFLGVNAELAGLARAGPIHRQADGVRKLLSSPATQVHLVCLLEEMPVQETLEAVEELRAAQIGLGAIIVNQARSLFLSDADLDRIEGGELDADELAAGLELAGIEPTSKLLRRLGAETTAYASRLRMEQRMRHRLTEAGLPIIDLPRIVEGINLVAVRTLADELEADRRWQK